MHAIVVLARISVHWHGHVEKPEGKLPVIRVTGEGASSDDHVSSNMRNACARWHRLRHAMHLVCPGMDF